MTDETKTPAKAAAKPKPTKTPAKAGETVTYEVTKGNIYMPTPFAEDQTALTKYVGDPDADEATLFEVDASREDLIEILDKRKGIRKR